MHTFSIIWSTCNLYPSHFSKITDLKCIFISFHSAYYNEITKVLGSSEYYCNVNFKLY